MEKRGKFITFEGCEGCGKSTQVRLFNEYLNKENIPHIFTREPGGEKISEEIRRILLDANNAEMTDECEALLYAAARVQHLNDRVEPALSKGELVFCDRYVDSSLAYQAYARGLGYDFVSAANKFALDNAVPDITIFLDFDPEHAFIRKGGADKTDRLELAGIEFHKRVYDGYNALAQKFPQRIARIDASKQIDAVHNSIITLLKEKGLIK